MKLTLLFPGLSWLDAHDGGEVSKSLPLPALQQLLGKGRLSRREQTLSACVGRLWGGAPAGLAGLAASQAGLAGEGEWLFADPVHLRVDRDRALLADVGVMQIAMDEAQALIDALNRHFGEDGLAFHPLRPGRWLLNVQQPLAASFDPLWDVVGEDINRHLPQGEHGLAWSRMLNELQMLLYTQPLNDERELRGDLAINSVWLWGEGSAPAWSAPAPSLLADDETLALLAMRSGMAVDSAPFAFDGLPLDGDCLLMLDALQAAAQYRDAWGWREGLQRLERDWFAPLLRAVRQRRITELNLIATGPAGFELQVKPADLWKFWKRALPLAALY
ncbi:hypothetical protein [Chromobacterium sphagni]|uniref:Phosphoglycerate mutase n=1 Tax=Chromobacterium sphagni TaxID=1903179 RepID=A0A1S1WVE2_9NEIS|nr:hypothetical protein [Chromobacterium sphagni]OHX10897.1 hypothetical protein BI347_20185 [Chromobacterium sphagni]OHX19518.1 hypothetical protein BI344_18180 [Chromobacterium sphagni]